MWKAALGIVALLACAPAFGGALDAVESKQITLHDFRLDSGVVLPSVTICYETYGQLATNGRNAVLVTHSFTSSQHAAGFYAEGGAPPGHRAGDIGWWDKVIGPGEAIDTDSLYVISSNALGSSFGSTSPVSLDPKTGKPYGPDFPVITVGDIVRAQKAVVDALGVKHLVAVVGASYGGFEAFEWAVEYPEFVDGVAPLFTAANSQSTGDASQAFVTFLAQDPNWNGGHYYDHGGVTATLAELRVRMLKSYGAEGLYSERYPNPAAREAAIENSARAWARIFDANSLIALLKAHEHFDVRGELGRIKSKVLYMLSSTDRVFPAAIGADVMARLKAAGVDARYVEVESEIGHLALDHQTEKWSGELGKFMEGLRAKKP